ncbi:LysR family transcriptional regulator [Aeoliella mucimassa]|uniref:HTH-type transcriptional activator CmpR n=1 Tax=Aeoliella mucimassa TaxID=2527972 RepID=A0A518AT37_9BACT|nr:LysR family transcriptional regulator [Aeoliella mucimassa]QDU57881.1 HTH-type transcriptional activator CmpR [Aeoliella mucimassa]
MYFKPLRIFCDVVRHRSFSRAADANGVSQPNASQAVHQLEQHLGVQLLDRSRRPFVLTAEGEQYYEGCRKLLVSYDSLERKVRSLHDAAEARVNVASIYSVGLAHMSQFLSDFRTNYPDSDVRLEFLHPDRVIELVETHQADFGIVSYPQETKVLAAVRWRNEPMVIVVPPSHSLADSDRVPLEKLNGETMVAFARGLKIREEIDRQFALRNVQVSVGSEFDNIEIIKRAVEAGHGMSLLPEPTVQHELAAGSLVAIELSGQQITRPLGIMYHRDHELSNTAKRFLEYLQQHADDQLVAPLIDSQATANHNHTVKA